MPSKTYFIFLIKFLLLFCVLYFGTYAFIGLSVEGGRYIPFLKQIDYVSWYRQFLLQSAEQLLKWMGYNAYTRGAYYLYLNGKNGIQLIYECLGIGVLSFWVSFLVTDLVGNIKTKIKWILIGLFTITILNILRIAFLLLAAYKHWISVGVFDHHTLYNTIVYICIIGLLLYYRKKVIE
ncbi:MAG: archaeosortase/exosortase family protein [Sediminibacterium sp.]|nr:archaeosortase/exosortase family protein [Sediminibacterium sp.]